MKLPKFKNPFNQYPKMETAVSLEVKLINPNAEAMDEVLGISSDRSKELVKMVRVAIQEGKVVTDVFVSISKSVNHPNEFAYAMNAYGIIAHKQTNPFQGLIEMFKKDMP